MLALWTKFLAWKDEEKGASMVEYALLVALIAIVAIIAIIFVGEQVSTAFENIGDNLSNAG